MAERIIKVKAVAGFVMNGRKPVEEGEELELPRVFAHELMSAGKAVRIPDAPKEAPKSEPPKSESPSDPPRKASKP